MQVQRQGVGQWYGHGAGGGADRNRICEARDLDPPDAARCVTKCSALQVGFPKPFCTGGKSAGHRIDLCRVIGAVRGGQKDGVRTARAMGEQHIQPDLQRFGVRDCPVRDDLFQPMRIGKCTHRKGRRQPLHEGQCMVHEWLCE